MAEADWVGFRDPQIGTTAEQIAERCGWQMRSGSGGLRVCADEHYTKTTPRMLSLKRLIDAQGADDAALAQVAGWGQDDLYARIGQATDIDAEVARLTASPSREGGWAAHALLLQTLPPSALPDHLRGAYEALIQPGLFPGVSFWSVHESATASYRNQVVRSLIAAEHLPEVVKHVKTGGFSIGMGTGLGTPRLGIPVGERLSPLLASAAPWLIGFVTERIGGAIVFMLGKLEFGKSAHLPYSDLIDELQPRFFQSEDHGSRQQPEITSDDTIDALHWWIEGLNKLVAVELDPATHASDGIYDPVRQMAMSLTIDRLVATVQQIAIADRRNSMIRKLLLFDSLDLIEGLLPSHSSQALTSAKKANKQLKELERVMPPAVQRVLLPRCRAAVAALTEMRNGFWVPDSRTATGVVVPSATGTRVVPYDDAVGMVLRMIRNGHHGFVSDRFHRDMDDRAMLTLHDGHLPDALPDLAFFHLVRLIAFADLLDPGRLYPRRPDPDA